MFCNNFSRKVILEKWFCKLVFSGQPLFSNQKKGRFIVQNYLFFWSTTFQEPDFLNQISKNWKNRGSRIKGWMSYSSLDAQLEIQILNWLYCTATTVLLGLSWSKDPNSISQNVEFVVEDTLQVLRVWHLESFYIPRIGKK